MPLGMSPESLLTSVITVWKLSSSCCKAANSSGALYSVLASSNPFVTTCTSWIMLDASPIASMVGKSTMREMVTVEANDRLIAECVNLEMEFPFTWAKQCLCQMIAASQLMQSSLLCRQPPIGSVRVIDNATHPIWSCERASPSSELRAGLGLDASRAA